jgi:NADH dehydrogenase/NADH:ubiquinone oxidoreductase subunit G
MNAPPMLWEWTDDGTMKPKSRFTRAADDAFTVGEVYRMEVQEQRSLVSHNHYFATLNDIWLSLPERFGDRIPSAEHMRKWALIRTGYRDERSIVCASKAEAARVAAFVKPLDDFALVVVNEATVSVYTAKSQSHKAMGGKEFQKSKEAVLDYCNGLLRQESEAA